MPRIYLPTHKYSGPYPFPKTKKEELLQRLYKTNTLLPGAKDMDIEELKEHVQAQEGKEREGYYEKKYPSKRQEPLSAHEREQAKGALREYTAWRRNQKQAEGLIPRNE